MKRPPEWKLGQARQVLADVESGGVGFSLAGPPQAKMSRRDLKNERMRVGECRPRAHVSDGLDTHKSRASGAIYRRPSGQNTREPHPV